jgi:hypothetical protein
MGKETPAQLGLLTTVLLLETLVKFVPIWYCDVVIMMN